MDNLNERQTRERNIIGFSLVDENAAYIALDRLKASDFENSLFSAVFEAMQGLRKSEKPIAAAFISRYLNDNEAFATINALYSEFELVKGSAVQNMDGLTLQAIEDSYKQRMEQIIATSGTASETAERIARLEEERQSRTAGTQNKPDNMKEYLQAAFAEDLKAFKKSDTIKTGFKNYDELSGGLFPGLYVIGAISSLGKTTFTHQMCDHIARTRPVLFFSLEQSKLELITKSIARLNAQQQHRLKGKDYNSMGDCCTPAIHLRQHGINTGESKAALNEYTETIARNMHIIEGNFNTTVDYIRAYTKQFIAAHPDSSAPVVVVDYLQIMQNTNGNTGNNKDNVDRNVTELKRFSRDLNIAVIVISSFNRTNYMTPVSFESFKESGGIEYTADVVIGLQLTVLDDDLFNKEGNIKYKRDKFKEAKQAKPREIQLCCIKNRNGVTSFDAFYKYYPQYDIFTEAEAPKNSGTIKKSRPIR